MFKNDLVSGKRGQIASDHVVILFNINPVIESAKQR